MRLVTVVIVCSTVLTMGLLIWILVVAVGCMGIYCEEGGSYSFYKFSGPVSGEVLPIYITNGHGEQKIDYIAKPDYSYSYGVKDPLTGNNQEREETRDGDVVRGQYSVLEADGTTRIVRYTADPRNGFQAFVEYH